jgi:hypothetical protein
MTDREVAAATGVQVNTLRAWRKRGYPHGRERRIGGCPACCYDQHDFGALPAATYAYLLGVYLGDGTVLKNKTSFRLQIALDERYPKLIDEAASAAAVLSGRHSRVRVPPGRHYALVTSSWKAWPCLLPQHGPGRKHKRPIVLTDWQKELVAQAPGSLLRGLIQTDGWRGMNKVRSKGKDYAYPRYQFSNRSDDIRKLFTDTCEVLGIEWSQWTRYHVSVARRDSVALLDTFVGPKY